MNLAAEGGGKGVGVAGGEDWGGVEFGGLEAEHVLVGVGGHVEGLGFEGARVPEHELIAAGDDGEAAAQEGVGDGEAEGVGPLCCAVLPDGIRLRGQRQRGARAASGPQERAGRCGSGEEVFDFALYCKRPVVGR